MQTTTHFTTRDYLMVGAALILLTFLEVGAVYLPQFPTLPALLLFGSLKAILIAMFFMHLKFDNRVFSFLFAIGIGLGLAMVSVLVFLLQSGTFAVVKR
ncbi:MAG: cytochrome C oxidase subunit IV family protein [Chloroflexi bacterium]|nr:cytochrome C oxidase subunit IV family protein [Chloroflexota bacterium]